MTRWLVSLTFAAGLLAASPLLAHGGTYRGPGDTVPPGGGGGATPTAPTAPTAPSAPSTPGAAAPSAPSTPSTPAVAAAPAVQPSQAVTAVGDTGPDLNTWEFWWEFNKDAFLNLKAKVTQAEAATGESELLVGLGGASAKNNTFRPTPQQINGVILPALKEALAKEDSRDIRSSCMIALGKIGNDPNIPGALEPFFKEADQEISETTALAFGILQHVDALPTLRDLLLDTENGRKIVDNNNVPDRTRAFAVYGLGLIAHAVADPAIKADVQRTLWDVLNNDKASIKDVRVACVVSLGLLELDDPTPLVQQISTYLADGQKEDLVRAHCPNAMAKLLRKAAPGSPQVAAAITQFQGLMDDKETPVFVRQSCIQALGMMAPAMDEATATAVAAKLVEVADKGKDQQERNYTAISLAYLGAAAPEGSPVRAKADEFLSRSLEKGSSTYRTWCGLALGVMYFKVNENHGTVPATIAQGLRDAFNKASSPSSKECFAIALGLMHDQGAKEMIHKELDKAGDPGLRGYLCVALGLLGAKEYTEQLTKIVEENRRIADVVQQAAVGLGLMSDRNVVDVLLKIMLGDGNNTPSLAVLSATANALGFIGDYRTVEPLVGMLRNQDITPLGRAFAAVALGLVADKETLPWNSKISADLNYRAAVETLVDPQSGTGVLDIL